MMKRIVLCADDYGQAPAISQGILSLVKEQRLSAVSCMVNTPFWVEHATWLVPYQNQVDIGLHFNLTHGKPLSPEYTLRYGHQLPTLSGTIKKSLLRQWDKAILVAECCAQVEEFRRRMGFLPSFIDGHQHIHQFPIVREALIEAYKRYWNEKEGAFIRLVNQVSPITSQSFVKLLTIRATGLFFQQLLKENAIPFNQSFAGIYPFTASNEYSTWFPRFLKKVKDNGLIMCHPALPSIDPADPIAASRYDEYRYFISPQFLLECERHAAVLSRFTG